MATLSKAEYLKKYISDGTESEKKKKRKKRKPKSAQAKADRLKIVDDDVDFKSLLPDNLGNTLEEDVGDDEPTIADFIDERPEHVKLLEKYREDDRWRILGDEKGEHKSDNIKQRQKHDIDSDQSPPRRRHDSESDQSPLGRRRHDSESDQSSPRRRRHDSESDPSPPGKRRHDSDSDPSPPRRRRHDSESDQSPPRRRRHPESDQSPPRRRRHDSESDQSPPRRKRRHNSEPDEKPRKQKGSSVNSDLSPQRKRKEKTPEEVTRTRKKKSRWEAEGMGSDEEENTAKALAFIKDARGRAAKTLGGATAGLSSAQQMKYEAKLMKEREEELFRKLDDEALGRNAKTIHRGKKSGKKRNMKEEEEISAEEAAKAAAKAEKYKAWNKGLKQAELRQQALEETMHEISKPLTRHRDDADLEALLKAQEREGDPMLAFIKKKKSEKNAKKKELPRYSGPEPPPNRFNIWPGYRWDGVDRSNGFEKKFFSKLCEKKAVKEIAYKWSVEDM